MSQPITEKTITDYLNGIYTGNSKYKLANAYIFRSDWESDFFVLKPNGYCYEFEVKISRGDFFSDKKKVDKHLILETGTYKHTSKKGTYNKETRVYDYVETTVEKPHEHRPNKFYYVVPDGLITVDEVPAYAGLIYYNVGVIKEAPFIHKTKLEFGDILCSKFYGRWLDGLLEIWKLKQDIKELEYEISLLKSKESHGNFVPR